MVALIKKEYLTVKSVFVMIKEDFFIMMTRKCVNVTRLKQINYLLVNVLQGLHLAADNVFVIIRLNF